MNLRYNKDIPNPNNLFFTQQNTIKYPFVCACMRIYYINTYFFLKNTCNSLNYKRRDFTHYQGVMGGSNLRPPLVYKPRPFFRWNLPAANQTILLMSNNANKNVKSHILEKAIHAYKTIAYMSQSHSTCIR